MPCRSRLAHSVIRRTAIFLVAIGGIADIGRRWRELVMTQMTHNGQNIFAVNISMRLAPHDIFRSSFFIGQVETK